MPADDVMSIDELAEAVLHACRARGLTLATAESLTAGLVADALARIPGASTVLLGGIVAYTPEVKERLLGVPGELLEHVVSAEVAEAMALGACRALGADVGLGTTGAAGPEPLAGQPPGTAFVAVRSGDRSMCTRIQAEGPRNDVRAEVARAALALAVRVLESD